MKREYATYAVIAMLLATWTAPAFAASAGEMQKQFLATIDELMPGMGAEKIVDRQKSQTAFEQLCVENSGPAKQAEQAALCAAMMERVGPDVAMPARVWLLRKVETIGRDEVVGRLTELMGDKEAQIRELARRALENNPAPSAGAALRQELDAAKDDAWRVALINALAFRLDGQASPQIAKLAADSDTAVATAAVSALGSIADDKALETLAAMRKEASPPMRDSVAAASLKAAETLIAKGNKSQAATIYESLLSPDATESVRIAAVNGIAAAKSAEAVPQLLKLIAGKNEHMRMVAGQCVASIPGESVTRQLVDALAGASPDTQAVLIDSLGQRGDASALPAILKLMKSDSADVRIAAAGALRHLGNGSTVESLVDFAAGTDGAERDAARGSLQWMRGRDVDEAIVKMIPSAKDRARSELVRAAAVRNIKSAYDLLLRNTNDPDESVRVAAISSIGASTAVKDLPKALKAFENLSGEQTLQAAKEALVAICKRQSEENQQAKPLLEAMPDADPSAQVIAIQALTSLRGQETLEALQKLRESKNAAIKQAADTAVLAWDPVHCTQWVWVGPFKKEGVVGDKLFDMSFPPEESKAKVEWKPLQRGPKKEKNPEIDLLPISNEENCCVYLQTRVRSKNDCDVVLSFGSDDGIKVWLNGAVMHTRRVSEGFKLDADKLPAKLKKGWNTVLVKVTQVKGEWAFSFGIKAADGGPVEGLKFEAR